MAAKERTGESTSLWAGLATGLAIAAGVGVLGIIVYLLIRDRSGQQPTLLGQPPTPQMIPYPVYMPATGGAPVPMQSVQPQAVPGATAVATQSAYRPNSVMNTRRLPSLAAPGSQAVRVAGNDDSPTEAMLRAMGPPGSFATLSFSPAELNTPGLGATIPNGFAYTIPAGESQSVRLNRGQVLYGKGNTDGVQIATLSNMIPEVG